MEIKLLEIKAAITALVAAFATFLGWQGMLLCVWMALMAIDYVSGCLAAKVQGNWQSKLAREGIAHKFGMALVVVGGFMADVVFAVACKQFPQIGFSWPFMFAPLLMIWYSLTELGSIMANACEMGAPIPGWMIYGLKMGKDALDNYTGKVKKDE